MAIKNLNEIIDNIRKQGRTDTQIMNFLSAKNPNIADGRKKASAGGRNDKDMLNFLSFQNSGKQPTVPSVPIQETAESRKEARGKEVDRLMAEIAEKQKGGAKPQRLGIKERIKGAFPQPLRKVSEIAGKVGEFARKPAEFLFGSTGRLLKKFAGTAIEETKSLAGIETPEAEKIGLKEGEVPYREAIGAVFELSPATIAKAIKPGAKMIGKKLFPKISIDDLVGRIAQTKDAKEITKAKKALRNINISGVKSFNDLTSFASGRIKALAESQDKILNKVVKAFPTKELDVVKKIGDKKIKRNFVELGLEQLKKLYGDTNDLDNLARITNLQNKIKKSGATVTEINNLAREHVSEMPSAFSKDGVALTSVTKLASEGVRKGLKNTARKLLPDDASKMLDNEMTNLFTLKKLTSRMEGAVRGLKNKVQERGLFERGSRVLANAVDAISLKTVSGFSKRLLVPSSKGFKTLDSLDLQNNLKSNLIKIRKLEKQIDGTKKLDKVEAGVRITALINNFLSEIGI